MRLRTTPTTIFLQIGIIRAFRHATISLDKSKEIEHFQFLLTCCAETGDSVDKFKLAMSDL